MSDFAAKLATGQLGESLIARWCLSRGNSIIPVYEKEIDTGKGPRFFSPEGQFVAPDMFLLPAMMWRMAMKAIRHAVDQEPAEAGVGMAAPSLGAKEE